MTNKIVRKGLLAREVITKKCRLGIGAREIFALLSLMLASLVLCVAQSVPPATDLASTPEATQPAPTFRLADRALHQPLTIIAYGDMRFTDPSNVMATNPGVRQALIERIAKEKPDAVLLTGDVPLHGGQENDYAVYKSETRAWRETRLRIYPALGNHEFAECDPQQCLENWWRTFPELKGHRWYSVQVGTEVYAIVLDSDASLLPQSQQSRWLESQIASLPAGIKFVLITLHHPPVADMQTKMFADHNPRENEIALVNFLETNHERNLKFIVIAGHIHNYERFEQKGVIYLISGGGGAMPYPVERDPADAYQDSSFPNYHYLKFVLADGALKATMFRLADPNTLKWEVKDTFEVRGSKTQE